MDGWMDGGREGGREESVSKRMNEATVQVQRFRTKYSFVVAPTTCIRTTKTRSCCISTAALSIASGLSRPPCFFRLLMGSSSYDSDIYPLVLPGQGKLASAFQRISPSNLSSFPTRLAVEKKLHKQA